MIKKSVGQTPTESMLIDLCNRTFLDIWAYANPYNDEHKEFCDVIAVFENHLFIFFDREKVLSQEFFDSVMINWDRWYRRVVEAQVQTCRGAERYLRSGHPLYLDAELRTPLPIRYDPSTVKVHRIVVANGAAEACKTMSSSNVNGSLAVSYRDKALALEEKIPFCVELDRSQPIHVLDSHTLPILLSELDTFSDFLAYIEEKEFAIERYSFLSYSGEEDLLAHYLMNFDNPNRKHYIGTNESDVTGVVIGEGDWNEFIKSPAYKSRKEANSNSYFWDKIIRDTLNNALNDKLTGNSDVFQGPSALYEMSKEPRLLRRVLSDGMLKSIAKFPVSENAIVRNISFMPSHQEGVAYIFLQLKAELPDRQESEIRSVRTHMLEVACASAKNHYPHLKRVIGIAMEPPKLYERRSEDFLLFDCSDWTEEKRRFYEELNDLDGMHFFTTGRMVSEVRSSQEFPESSLR